MRALLFSLTITVGGLGSLTSHAESTAAPQELVVGSKIEAKDTLNIADEKQPDTIACLQGLAWSPTNFTVTCETKTFSGDYLLRYPTPLPSGDAINDLAALEWHVARDAEGHPRKAPAIVVVHESGRGMLVGRLFATGMRLHGFHTFLVHLPGYGVRTSEFTKDIKRMLPGLRQAVADVRRARDAVAALPFVDATCIGLQGTSLGGFVTATTAGLDHGFDRTFVLLAGGNLHHMIMTGQRDAAAFRGQLLAVGMTEADIKSLTEPVEPLRLANRVQSQHTWLFSGSQDEVVPPTCSHQWAKAAHLDQAHHLEMKVGHYDAGMRLPTIMTQISNLMRDRPMNETLPAGLATPVPNGK